jgi:hypothetical protein
MVKVAMASNSNNVNHIAKLATRGWVSLSGFAIIADMSYPTAIKLANEGKLLAIPVGGAKRVYRQEVERFLREGNYKGGAQAPPFFSGE